MSRVGCWIFLSHSSQDIMKVREIRNEFEKRGHNPLAFHLRCLNTDTEEGEKELDNLIKREIDSREWFVFCESNAAKESKYVQMEKDYIEHHGKAYRWKIDMSLPMYKIIEIIDKICRDLKVFVSYAYVDRFIKEDLIRQLIKKDYEIWTQEDIIREDNYFENGTNQYFFDYSSLISQCGTFLPIITEHYVNSVYCMKEFEMAMSNNLKIIPIMVGDVEVPNMIRQCKCYKIDTALNEGNVDGLIFLLNQAKL